MVYFPSSRQEQDQTAISGFSCPPGGTFFPWVPCPTRGITRSPITSPGERRARGVYRKIAPNLLRPLDSVPWDRWSFHAGKSVRIAPVVGHFFPNRGEAAVWEKVVRRRSDSNTRRRHLRLDPYRPDPSRPARSIPRWETSLPPKRLISGVSHVLGAIFPFFLHVSPPAREECDHSPLVGGDFYLSLPPWWGGRHIISSSRGRRGLEIHPSPGGRKFISLPCPRGRISDVSPSRGRGESCPSPCPGEG